MDWIDLAGDRDEWWAVVNTVMNISVPYKEECIDRRRKC
jgi:hypothetical protein